jgi:integrase
MERDRAKRRGWGEDSVFQRSDGMYVAVIERGTKPDGKRDRLWLYSRTKKGVLAKLKEAHALIEAGVSTTGTTVGAFLQTWLDTVIAARVGENTVDNYRIVVTTHLIPGLGRARLDELTAEHVDQFLADKATEGYSKSYVTRMRTILIDALNHALRRNLIVRNTAALSIMPRIEAPAKRRSLSLAEADDLIAAAEGERLKAMVVVGLNLALRPGEMTGLLWSDVDLGERTLAVTGSIKRRPNGSLYRGEVKRSTDGQRIVGLPLIVVTALREHKAVQAAERLAAGKAWTDHGLIFGSEVGTPLDPSNVRRLFTRIGKKAGMADAIPYLLRHSGVSLLIDNGASIEEVADLTGDDPRTLYRVYRHKTRPVANAAADRMDGLLGQQRGS